MADRQYGIPPGISIDGALPSQQPGMRGLRPRSPPREYMLQRSEQYNHGPISPETGSSVDTPPPPPVHRSNLSPTGHSFLHAPVPQAVESSSDVSDYHPPDPLRDVDNLYNPATRTPSPVRNSSYHAPRESSSPQHRPILDEMRHSQQSIAPLTTYAALPGLRSPSPMTSGARSPYRDAASSGLSAPSLMARQSHYHGDGYDEFDPSAIADDVEDDIERHPPRSRSRMGFGAATAGAAAGLPTFLRPFGSRDTSGQYGPLPNVNFVNDKTEVTKKSDWLQEQQNASRHRKRILWILGGIVLLLIVAGAVVGGVLATRSKSSSTSGSASSNGTHSSSLYDIKSNEVQQVMNNKDLHRVFPAMDYTPLNAQYPACLDNPPDQNNVTLDIAMLSQLTPAVRLYGTDCNQAEMVLTAIDRLQMNSTMSMWIGVWLGTNATTNARQLAQMYDILDKYPTSHFAGVIIGNEVLFRKDMTLTQLAAVLTDVRSKLAAKKINLPVSTSDLGDNWTQDLAATSDIVMANVHPFFAGVTPDVAPGWTYNFWQTHDASLATAKTGSWPKSIISEVGWPSEGGNDCGTTTGTCSAGQGAVASITNLNKFMDGFVCQSLTNGTSYFWFEAFDEPWKVIFETGTDGWESHWGLMDTNRNLKTGIKIPDCGGKTLSKPY